MIATVLPVVVAGFAAATVVLAPTDACANTCQQSCRAAWNQCRIATKGSPACDAKLQACMQSCIAKR